MKKILSCLLALAACSDGRPAQITVGAHHFTLPEGMTIELIAGPPLVDRPISASFDDQGRLYVTDSSGTNEKPEKQLENPTHRLVRLEDSDGDGRFDRSLVVADKLMFPEGCLWYGGSVYIGAPPSIWKLTDTDGDGVADRREEWFKQGVLTGCANDVHGPYLGPDGWLYWTKGAFAQLNLTAADGTPITDKCAHIFRRHPNGGGLESVMAGGMDNPVEVAFTRAGEPIFTSTFIDLSGPGKRDGLAHAVYGGVFGKVNEVTEGVARTGDLMPVMTHFGPGAPSGLCRYQSEELGVEYRDAFFATLFNMRKVTRHQLEPAGGTFRTHDTDFVVSDNPDFHPTDVLEDADGSLLIVDTGGWYKMCCPTSQLAKPDVLGGIYRVRRAGVPGQRDPWLRRVAWEQMAVAELNARLASPRWAERRLAAHRLERSGEAAVPELAKVLVESAAPQAREEAAWLLVRIGGERAAAALRMSLRHSDSTVRQIAAKAAALRRDAEALSALRELARDPDAATARVAVEALGRLRAAAAVEDLLGAAQRGEGDRYFDHSVIYALIEIADPAKTAAGLSHSHPSVRRVALIALDQMRAGGLQPERVIALLRDDTAVVREAAQWIVSRHPEWGGAMASYFEETLRSGLAGSGDASERPRELELQLARMAKNAPVQELLRRIATDSDAPTAARAVALSAMARSGLREAPIAWFDALAELIESSVPPWVRPAIEAARQLPWPKAGHARLGEALTHIGRDSSQDAALRLEALAAVPGGLREPDAALFDFLQAQLAPERPVGTRGAAAAVLARSRLTELQLERLTESIRGAGPMEIDRLMGAYDRATNEALGLKLIGALSGSKALAALRPDRLRFGLTNFPPVVQVRGRELLAALDLDEAKQAARLDQLLAELKDGDIRRGQAVFNSAKAACSTCHTLGYLGGKIGPDLTSIGQVRSERDLLESIIFPSASFVRSYEPYTVVTKDGEEHSGVLRRDAADEIVLATSPDLEVRLARAEIAEIRPGRLSTMPQGLDEQLDKQELADLLAFLKNTRWGPQ